MIARARTEREPERSASFLDLIGKRAIAPGVDACLAALPGHPVRARAAAACLTALGALAPGEPTSTEVPAATAPPVDVTQVIGKRVRTGIDLSGGEWQKIAIARAYMRDAQVLILDEPTAALDARSEFEVFQRFKELSRGKTAVLISHRFSSVRMADRIMVLGDGMIEAVGTHEELLTRGGRYAELFELQAAGYR